MKLRSVFAALAFVSASQATNVWAQAFLSDPRLTDGLGVKAGDFELHPGIAAEGGYDSNYFQRSGVGTESPVISAYRLRITPSLAFATSDHRESAEGGGPPPAVKLSGLLAASYNALFAADSKYQHDVSNQDNVSGQAGLRADILPERPWGGDIYGNYLRVLEASNDPATSNAFRRDTVDAGAGISWLPGGGLFKWRLGYGIRANFFEDSGFNDLNNLQNRVETQTDWKFLPRTALVYKGELDWITFPNHPALLNNGEFLRSQIGLNGLITEYFGLLVLGGWGASFFDNRGAVPAENFDSFIGQAELTWYPAPQRDIPEAGKPVGLSSVSLGYHRDFSPSYLGSYYQLDRGYLNLTYLFGQRFATGVNAGISHITRPQSFFPDGTQDYKGGGENRVDALGFFEYRPTPSLGINVTLRYDAELTKVDVPIGKGPGAAFDDLEFKRVQAYLGLRWFL